MLLASPSYFDVLGVRPQLGRLFGPEDNAPGITEVVVISDELWHRRFAASPQAIGRKLRIDNDWYTVVGVLPPEFQHPGRSVLTDVDLWAPCNFSATPFPMPPPRGGYFITGAIGRLKSGDLHRRGAVIGLRRLATDLRQSLPNDYPARAGWTPRLIPLQDDLVGSVRPALLMLFGAVGFVLLIACANIANLLLARGSGRQRELACPSRARLVAGAARAAAADRERAPCGARRPRRRGRDRVAARSAASRWSPPVCRGCRRSAIDQRVLLFNAILGVDDRRRLRHAAGAAVLSTRHQRRVEGRRPRRASGRRPLRFGSGRRSNSRWRSCCSSARRCSRAASGGCSTSISDSIRTRC